MQEQPSYGDGGEHVLACPKTPVSDLMDILPARFITKLERDQTIASCCRNPEQNGEISAWWSKQSEKDRAAPPDVYIIQCQCGKKHRNFMVGTGIRPFWDKR